MPERSVTYSVSDDLFEVGGALVLTDLDREAYLNFYDCTYAAFRSMIAMASPRSDYLDQEICRQVEICDDNWDSCVDQVESLYYASAEGKVYRSVVTNINHHKSGRAILSIGSVPQEEFSAFVEDLSTVQRWRSLNN